MIKEDNQIHVQKVPKYSIKKFRELSYRSRRVKLSYIDLSLIGRQLPLMYWLKREIFCYLQQKTDLKTLKDFSYVQEREGMKFRLDRDEREREGQEGEYTSKEVLFSLVCSGKKEFELRLFKKLCGFNGIKLKPSGKTDLRSFPDYTTGLSIAQDF